MNFCFSFPAIRGCQAQKEFFTIMCPLEVLSKLFDFYNDEIPEEHRAQRILNEKRIPKIKNYILQNPRDYVFSSITASIDGEYSFESTNLNKDIGILSISMNSNLLINDGQHRKAAIDEAIKENPNFKNESISVVLFVDEGLKKSQQMFSDLNQHAVNVSNSLGILYNHRDPDILFTKSFLNNHKSLFDLIDKSNNSISQKSNKLFTLSNFHTAFTSVYNGKDIAKNTTAQKFTHDYWDYLINNFSEWRFVINKEYSPYSSRKSSVASYGVVLEALGLIGNYIFKNNISPWRHYIDKLNQIDWTKTNQEHWLYRCILNNGNVHKSQLNVRLTAIKIKILIGLKLTKTELCEEEKFRKEYYNEY